MASKQVKISRISFVIVFVALIRLLSECFRLNYLAKEPATFTTLEPYLVGALICAVTCLAMTVFSFYVKSTIVIGIAIFTIIVLVFIKIKYSI